MIRWCRTARDKIPLRLRPWCPACRQAVIQRLLFVSLRRDEMPDLRYQVVLSLRFVRAYGSQFVAVGISQTRRGLLHKGVEPFHLA